jgi:hypothetical protein
VIALSVGDLLVRVVGYGAGAFTVVLILWVALYKLRFPPVVNAVARIRRRQTKRNMRTAAELGLQYRQDDDSGLLDLPLSLMSFGRNRWIHSVMFGSYRGRDVRVFRIYYQVPGGRYGPTLASRRGVVARIEAAFPHVVIERRGFMVAPLDVHGAEEMTFDPEFDGEYRVRTTDPGLTTEILDANLRRWLLELDERWRFEISGQWVLASHETGSDKGEPRGMLDVVSDLADRLPWILMQQHPAGSEPDPDPLRVGPPTPTANQRRRQQRSGRVVVAVSALFILAVLGAGVIGAYQNSKSPACGGCAGPTLTIASPTFVVPSIVIPSIVLPSASPAPTPTLTAGTKEPVVLLGTRPREQVTVTFEGLAVTPHPTIPPGRPQPPNTLGARFVIENTGTLAYVDYPANGIRLIDAAGRRYVPQILDSFKPGFGTIHLQPGDKVNGFVTFRIPASAHPAAITFRTDSGFGPQTARWPL